MENLEILVQKWNGTYHAIWNSSEIEGYRFTGLISDISLLRLKKLQNWIFTLKTSTRMDDVNGKRP